MVTIGAAYSFYRTAESKDNTRFNNEVELLQSTIENRINLYIALLKGGRGFIESTDKLSRSTFANYVNSLGLGTNYAGVEGIGYSKIYTPEDRSELINKMKSEGYADFSLFPDTERDLYQAIIYIEPFTQRNSAVIGYDMSTEENRRKALMIAGDSGLPTASSKVTLLQESEKDKQFGFLIYIPVYKNGAVNFTQEDRKKNLTGFIYSPFRAGNFLADVQKNNLNKGVEMQIYDGEKDPNNLLAQTLSTTIQAFTDRIKKSYSNQRELDVAGRKWTIEYSSSPDFNSQSNVGWTPLVFVSGVLFSLMIFAFMHWEASARAKMQTTAEELFELEKQKQILLENEQKARQSAEDANRAKDEFIAVVSHELRTPLNAIAGWTKILRTDSLSANTKKTALDKVDKNLRLQASLVEELLDYSQIISEGIIKKEKVVFSNIFESNCETIKEVFQKKNIEFVKQNQLNGHMVSGDEEKLNILVHNLFSNALKFTDEGGKVEVSVFENNGDIELVVKDNGKGISQDFLPHIFDNFRQYDNTTTRVYGGLGLGLAISSHIVKMHDGTIEAYSNGEGKGAVFTVKIPYIKQQM